MNIRPTNAIVKSQLNIDKIKTQVKPSFIDCLQHSIAKVKGENTYELQGLQREQTERI